MELGDILGIQYEIHICYVCVAEVTQNWSLECKIEVCWKTKIGVRFVEFGPRFWLPVGGFWFVKNQRPNGGIRDPVLCDNIFQKRIFWVRFVTIL